VISSGLPASADRSTPDATLAAPFSIAPIALLLFLHRPDQPPISFVLASTRSASSISSATTENALPCSPPAPR
jgi:hypothetical protein